MSDPVTKSEIEDVLSSIRRLVSEETRSEPRGKARPEPVKHDRLVLTPALRVGETEEDAEPEEPERNPIDPEAPWSDPEATLYEAAHVIAGEARLEAQSDESEPMMLRPEDVVPDTAGVEVSLSDEEDQAASPDVEFESLSARFEALETAISETADDEWEPDGSDEDVYGGSVEEIEWEDHDPEVTADVSFDEKTAATPPVEEPAPSKDAVLTDAEDEDVDDQGAFSLDEAVMDEEMLRELVADIVRQELQGALGERITRNVRKLVRREIHRALTAQEFD
ncbi:hypothetical protein ACFORG_18010 [Lutimaribacter marinistellae]|uniref:Glycerol-3-phosphate dehydrogenase n=1 Tax=Lutimaribacter marinistellae TaxID=1820329 RepID=A0ABV7TN78_9RHOB